MRVWNRKTNDILIMFLLINLHLVSHTHCNARLGNETKEGLKLILSLCEWHYYLYVDCVDITVRVSTSLCTANWAVKCDSKLTGN